MAHGMHKGKNEVNAIIGLDKDGNKSLLGVTVNRSWYRAAFEVKDMVSETATLRLFYFHSAYTNNIFMLTIESISATNLVAGSTRSIPNNFFGATLILFSIFAEMR